jgi:signal transduction histidine kinase
VLQGLNPCLEQWLMRLQDELTHGHDVCLRILLQGKPRPLTKLIEEQIYRIGREAVVNALRHSGATLVEIEIEYVRRQVRVLVRDNGRGFDSQNMQLGWHSHSGLRDMHERASRIGAKLCIWSRHGAGTEIEVLLPPGRDPA